MAPVYSERFGSSAQKKLRHKKHKPRQEISHCLKYLIFVVNFIFVLVGIICVLFGGYLCEKDWRPIRQAADVLLNPAVLLVLVGLLIVAVSFMGAIGALRDNIFLLKSFALTTFFCYILLVIATFVLFILFYSDTTDGLSAHSLLLIAIKQYDRNANLADFIDYVQEQLECCGATSASQGYKDWNLSVQYNCSTDNPYPEQCGVPFSCCRQQHSDSNNQPNIRSLKCWRHVQKMKLDEVEMNIYTRGCLHPLKAVFQANAVNIGAFVGGIIIPVCFFVCLSNILAKQIDQQKYLLEREERHNERRLRRALAATEHGHGHGNRSAEATRVKRCTTSKGKRPNSESPVRDSDRQTKVNKRRRRSIAVPVHVSTAHN